MKNNHKSRKLLKFLWDHFGVETNDQSAPTQQYSKTKFSNCCNLIFISSVCVFAMMVSTLLKRLSLNSPLVTSHLGTLLNLEIVRRSLTLINKFCCFFKHLVPFCCLLLVTVDCTFKQWQSMKKIAIFGDFRFC